MDYTTIIIGAAVSAADERSLGEDMERPIAGIDVGGTKIHTAVADSHGEILSEIIVPTNAHLGRESVGRTIIQSLETVCEESGNNNPAAISVLMPGPVDHRQKIVHTCPNIPDLEGLSVDSLLDTWPDTEIVLENDARAAGLAEAVHGAAADKPHVLYVTISTGIGGALIINREIYHGGAGAAGEIGMTRFFDGTVFETIVSGPAVERSFSIRPEEIPKKAADGDINALKALDHLVDNLGILLGNLTTVLSPDSIVIGGGLSNLGDVLIEPLEREIRTNTFSVSGTHVKVVRGRFTDRASIIGALILAHKATTNGDTT